MTIQSVAQKMYPDKQTAVTIATRITKVLTVPNIAMQGHLARKDQITSIACCVLGCAFAVLGVGMLVRGNSGGLGALTVTVAAVVALCASYFFSNTAIQKVRYECAVKGRECPVITPIQESDSEIQRLLHHKLARLTEKIQELGLEICATPMIERLQGCVEQYRVWNRVGREAIANSNVFQMHVSIRKMIMVKEYFDFLYAPIQHEFNVNV